MIVEFYSTYLADAHAPSMGMANKTGLPQTVFYHPDYGYTCTNTTALILRDKKTQKIVTWLPCNYFE